MPEDHQRLGAMPWGRLQVCVFTMIVPIRDGAGLISVSNLAAKNSKPGKIQRIDYQNFDGQRARLALCFFRGDV